MKEELIGFQLRIALNHIMQFDNSRRAYYLLREDIVRPLSVDETVWSGCEDSILLSQLFSDYSPKQYASPNGLGVYCKVSPAVLTRLSTYDGAFLIGITVVNDTSDRANELIAKHYINMALSIDQLITAGWKCLGYDIANYWLLSGLMNCGYEKTEKSPLVQSYAGGLNKYGLFKNADDAQRFRIDCDSRVPEHSPFVVYGIWANGNP